jgi:hypothetical protein
VLWGMQAFVFDSFVCVSLFALPLKYILVSQYKATHAKHSGEY